AGERGQPAHGADRGGGRGERSRAVGIGAGRAGARAPQARRLSGGAGAKARRRDQGSLSRRRNLRGIGDAHERAAGDDEELDSPRPHETEKLSRSMSIDDTTSPPDGGNLVAAEYVLGVLSAEERREVERRLAQEPTLAAEVAFWEERLTGLADTVAPVAPPPNAWSRIEAAIARPADAGASRWRSLAFWRGFGIGAAALATASIAALAYVALVPAARAPLMATLGSTTSGQPNFVAAVTASGDSLVIVPASLLTNDPRAIELWLMTAGPGQPPQPHGP